MTRINVLCLAAPLNQLAGGTTDCTIPVPEICQTFSLDSQSTQRLKKHFFKTYLPSDMSICQAKGLSTFPEQNFRKPLRKLLQTRPSLFWSCCVPDVGLCMKNKFLMTYFDWRANNQSNCTIASRSWPNGVRWKMFGIDCRRFLFSPPLPPSRSPPPHFSPIFCSPQACSFACPLFARVFDLRLERKGNDCYAG